MKLSGRGLNQNIAKPSGYCTYSKKSISDAHMYELECLMKILILLEWIC